MNESSNAQMNKRIEHAEKATTQTQRSQKCHYKENKNQKQRRKKKKPKMHQNDRKKKGKKKKKRTQEIWLNPGSYCLDSYEYNGCW